MNIVVLAGGLSPERDVSLSSGCLVANALMRRNHKVLLVDLFFGLNDTISFETAYDCYGKQEYHYTVPEAEPDLKQLMLDSGHEGAIGENVLAICQTADIVFLALHGSIGENGQIQAIFDAFNIRYTGTGYEGSLLAMNKVVSKELMVFHGIKTPEWVVYKDKTIPKPPFLPCVIKPVSCGSSIGVSIVETEEEFSKAIEYAKTYENALLIEKKIHGREFSVGILDGIPLPVIEIIPQSGFYDYKNKYQSGLTNEVCPAEISPTWTEKLQQYAFDVHKALRLGSYSRVDFIVDEDEAVYCLEANTLPGMTPTSLLPQEAQAMGIPYDALCEKIVFYSALRFH